MIRKIALAVTVAALAAWGVSSILGGPSYHVKVVLASATNLVVGGTVELNGFKAGTISSLSVSDGKAMLGLSLDKKYAPLHDGAAVTITWKALLGERIVYITDGKTTSAPIPDNGMIPGTQQTPVELDQVLNALDPTTRTHLVSLVNGLNQTISGTTNEANLAATIQSSGPALQALGGVLQALGTDGPAISNLVSRLNAMVSTLSKHDTDIAAMVTQVSHLTALTAAQKTNLAAALKELPGTLNTANSTLNDVPSVVSKADPLLTELAPVTAQLKTVASSLKPVLMNLQPLVAKLKPTLQAAAEVLQYSPGLLDTATSTLPGIQSTLTYLEPTLAFLRPYTPEVAAFFSNWASAMGNYDSNGHYARALVQAGMGSLDANPGVQPIGTVNAPDPLPGAIGNQPWTDAFGSGPK